MALLVRLPAGEEMRVTQCQSQVRGFPAPRFLVSRYRCHALSFPFRLRHLVWLGRKDGSVLEEFT